MIAHIDLEEQLDDVTGAQALWVTRRTDIHRVDVATRTAAGTLDLPGRPDALTAAADRIWVGVALADATGELYLIDEATNTPTLVASLPSAVTEIAVDAGTIWLTSVAPMVHRIDRATGTRRDFDIEAQSQGISLAFDAVWITVPSISRLLRLDPTSGQVVAEIITDGAPNELAVGDGVVWLTEEGAASVAAVDPSSNEIVQRLDVGAGPDRVVWADPLLVVANGQGRSLSILQL